MTGVSQIEGYTSGGQLLEITGTGFEGDNSEVTVDGVPCEVFSRTSTSVTCVTGAASQASVGNENQPGQHGLILTEKNVLAADFDNATADSVEIATSFEYIRLSRQYNQDELVGSKEFSGWFQAPATGDYRFVLSGDVKVDLYLDSTNPYVAGAVNVTEQMDRVAFITEPTGWRQNEYDVEALGADSKHISDWISLTENHSYRISAMSEGNPVTSHMAVAVEIKVANTTFDNHPKATKTITQFSYDPVNIQETWYIRIQNPD